MSLLKADTIKPVTSGGDLSLQGDSGGSAVDCLNITSAGDINFTGNTDAKIKLPSAGGIYESDGSTAVLTESGGAVTLSNVLLGSGVNLLTGVKTALNASGDAPLYACRAWVYFQGDATGTFVGGNIASVTDHTTGDFTINFTEDFQDTDYCATAMGGRLGDNASIIVQPDTAGYRTVGGLRCFSLYANSSKEDGRHISCAFFR